MQKFSFESLRRPVILDGAWGTELQGLGLSPGACPDAWNLSHPDRVETVARRYVEAGSQVILTNTFGANRVALSSHGLALQAEAINRAGARLSRRAAEGGVRVFASIGPSGKLLAMAQASEDELRAAFEEQAKALASEGVDALVLETFSDLAEARIALAAARTTKLPVVACMVFDSGAGRDRTMMGNTPEQVVRALAEDGADAIGANCGDGVERYVPICSRLRAATHLPLWLKPNAGLPKLVDGGFKYSVSPEQFAAGARALVEAGATFVGGCCGTSPAFVRALAQALATTEPRK